jgi:hypothetical protein
MGIFLAVDKGSEQEPGFIHMTYKLAKTRAWSLPRTVTPLDDPASSRNGVSAHAIRSLIVEWIDVRAPGRMA